ncbi:MAG: DUF3137 domain-containing protein [Hyphomonadaceae bacterium]|nr:DUF3137 domain-containing protein [Hyphomonadaceae bacterium]
MSKELSQFSENRPEFKGFNSFYYDNIFPHLLASERHREAAVKKAKTIGAGIAVVGLVAAIGLYIKTQSVQFPIFALVGSGIGAFATGAHLLKNIKRDTKKVLMTNMTNFVGWTYNLIPTRPPILDVWRNIELIPKYDRSSFEDEMMGNAHGADFVFCETHLEREKHDSDGDKKWVTVFRGLMFEIDFHMEFLGKTIVLRDAGIFNRKKRKDMKRVGLVDPKFEKIFEAYGTDQVEARYLLTPDFMQRLVDLESRFEGKKTRFGFLNGKLYIAIEAPNQFEAGSMFKPLTETERTQKILDEIGAIFDLVDGVLKPLKARRGVKG